MRQKSNAKSFFFRMHGPKRVRIGYPNFARIFKRVKLFFYSQCTLNYLLTESEVFTGSIRQGRGLGFPVKTERLRLNNKLFTIRLFALVLWARNRPVDITGE